jgi:uncharacterized membrane protein YfcA
MSHYIFISIVLFFASYVFGTAGFGFLLVALPLMSLLVSPKVAVPFLIIYGYGINASMLSRFRGHIHWSKIWPLMVGACPGIPIGVYVLKHSESLLIKKAVGVVVIAFALWNLVNRGERGYSLPRIWAFIIGFVGGIMAGAFGIAGPPIVIYTSLNRWDKNLARGTIQVLLFFNGTLTLIVLALTDILTVEVLRFNLLYLPVVAAGGLLGYFTFTKLSSHHFNRIINYLLLAVGLSLIVLS